ncbi:photosystem II repair protein Psb32 [[Limnothrix rosea] IAM M-220]|uniref:photosystem II repair protein Psb32 n=1 Tax=[Limnothrix rosea] IAM M-220 TaxID=454133 RepID=UPI0009694C36|nr:TPM domain-containing protein [[Limnothrix rosea] IAM M-220]OKH19720.1 beta-propeller domain-containing protein, methanol dehydrogenase [[Limnothrix rosea] IAM M-220]
MMMQTKTISRWQKLGLWLVSVVLVFGGFVLPAQATGVYDVPYSTPDQPIWLVDQAEAISRANDGRLNRELETLAEKTGKGLHFVAIRRLDYGQTIEEFAEKVFAKWFPTAADGSDEMVIAVDVLTNNVAIALGENLKEKFPEETIKSITEKTVGYPLRKSAYNQALLEAEERVSAIFAGEADPGPPQIAEINIESTFTKAEDTKTTSSTIWLIVLLVLATAIPMGTYWWYVR